jgi:hypothetical protein
MGVETTVSLMSPGKCKLPAQQFKLLKINKIRLVEAAGVEPASEIAVSRETPCVVCSEDSLQALRADKKHLELVR